MTTHSKILASRISMERGAWLATAHGAAESWTHLSIHQLSEKVDLKLNSQKTKIMASGLITSWQIDGEKMETVTDLFSWAPKSLWTVTSSHEIKRCLLLEEKL